MNRHQGHIDNLPNTLSIMRLVLIPAVMTCLYFPGRLGSFLAAVFFAAAAFTDLLDGFLARRYKTVTPVGKFLDPLADKLLVSVTMIMLITLGRIPAWMVILIIAREMAVTGLRSIAVVEGKVIAASSLGKYKTIFQLVSLICLCLHYQYINVDFHAVGMAFLWVALALTLWSGYSYFRLAKNVLM
ncbi:MAG: CDP-diacylglycerol--glycerol-3-phosphate 3-phosphatidyltransferase [Deltaproteobacteria bacterium]|nr:CDP-diacylglycerol--glycerol-3-phosphate 3-phosphatidyltransferase [Deltaproteobacteria bacterium]MBW2076304.1 CDP-diacylglycerol--glycerol-3-phosphate 3-phosphatidyltransferase [Deltaproteobacteria bacterium]MBW2311265.1 CDP-diacylglycerol--glycerol-3-phosphate 3-phosphatidyltransferase [Deltaproteobacteria bacterium]RLB31873.1 MAG: CDP-diacylglycerol--glycerol-3-phosphate 3-phosphatidyltransferase [Deltaproteobacteria bacterium]